MDVTTAELPPETGEAVQCWQEQVGMDFTANYDPTTIIMIMNLW